MTSEWPASAPVFTGPPGYYTVRAVDIAGIESEDGLPPAPIEEE